MHYEEKEYRTHTSKDLSGILIGSAKTEPELITQINQLEEQHGILYKMVQELEARLQPIVVDLPRACGINEEVKGTHRSEISNRVHTQVEYIKLISEKIATILAGLEI